MKNILFIEDDPDQIFIYEKYFSSRDKNLILKHSSNFAETIYLLRDFKPDLILSDILLNGENGLDIIENIKKEKAYQQIPVIIFTNYIKKEEKERALALGVKEYVLKTEVTPGELLVLIRKVLSVT
jgi:CheY-like chemotaxis protein